MKDLIIIVVYFGERWPDYFSFFLESCQRNSWIDWLIFTDIQFPENAPANCTFRKMSMSDFKTMAGKKLGINVSFEDPYKVCDFRIAFGVLFEKEIEGYRYWGHGDIDLVYGNLEKFIRYLLPYRNEVISFSSRRFLGCFGLLRNIQEVRNKFYNLVNWKELLENPKNLAVDETFFGNLFPAKNNFFQDLDPCERFFHGRDKEYQNNHSSVFECFWDNGKMFIFIEGEEIEIPFYHFHAFFNRSISRSPWKVLKKLIHVDYTTYKWRINSMGFFPY